MSAWHSNRLEQTARRAKLVREARLEGARFMDGADITKVVVYDEAVGLADCGKVIPYAGRVVDPGRQ